MTPLKTKFLLADDDPDDVEIFCEALSQMGTVIKCYNVDNGGDLFEFLSTRQNAEKPDIIFLDINMPVMNGWECLKKLKDDSEYKTIPAVIYSTSSAKQDVDMAYRLGASLFLTKPENFRELREILEIVATIPQELLQGHLIGFDSVKVV